MMTAAIPYLKAHTCYYINLDRSPARAAQWRTDIAPLFKDVVRVPATDWESVSDEDGKQFVDDWNILYLRWQPLLGVYMHMPQSQCRFNMKTAKANYAIRCSHLDALDRVVHGPDSWAFISEDDVTPRYSLWSDNPYERIDPPPAEADVAIWSGGLPMAAVRTDDKEYGSGRPFEWVRITPPMMFNTLGAGMYEVSRGAAEHLAKTVREIPMGSFDHAWGHAFRDLTVFRLRPQAFPQAGPSVRNHVTRTPLTDRTNEEGVIV